MMKLILSCSIDYSPGPRNSDSACSQNPCTCSVCLETTPSPFLPSNKIVAALTTTKRQCDDKLDARRRSMDSFYSKFFTCSNTSKFPHFTMKQQLSQSWLKDSHCRTPQETENSLMTGYLDFYLNIGFIIQCFYDSDELGADALLVQFFPDKHMCPSLSVS